MTRLPDAGAPERVVIVGGGFAGLACARALGSRPADVTLVDCQNYHLFVPLLYQVATAELSPAHIAEPFRRILRRHRNVRVVMGKAAGVDKETRHLLLEDGRHLPYDRLVLATGSAYSYFGHPEWAERAPGLKTLTDARRLRSRLLRAFEAAEAATDPHERAAWLTVVIVGGGPTGVEMAGAVAELAQGTLVNDFHYLDTRQTRVLLVEAGERILSGFPETLARHGAHRLGRKGVEIWTGKAVEDLNERGVVIAGEFVPARTVIWGAGVQGSAAAQWIGVEGDRQGRIAVEPDLSVKGMERVYALGDTARFETEDGRPLPALAQVAKQQGHHLGRGLAKLAAKGKPLTPFRFRNRGNVAVVGRNVAVVDFGWLRLKGVPGWLVWAVVHIYLLAGFENRLLVSLQWLWEYATRQRGSRLISDDLE